MTSLSRLYNLLCPDLPKVNLEGDFENSSLSNLTTIDSSLKKIFSERLKPLEMKGPYLNFEKNLQVAIWTREARDLFPEVNDWTGIYYKASFALGEDSTDLVLGPFIGAPTEHSRIPIDRGLCGLALKDEMVINIGNVKEDARYLACSFETQAEIVIPLTDSKGSFIAELDIDAHTANAFDQEKEAKLKKYCLTFSKLF